MKIISGTPNDLPRLIQIYDEARQIMRESGNLTQWEGGYPSEELIKSDIKSGFSYIVEDEGGNIKGCFALIFGEDPTYKVISGGRWTDPDSPYATIHRLASTKDSHGVAQCCFEWCWERINSLRADTHADNTVMQHCLEKAGFSYCGIIFLESGAERKAYQKIKTGL